MDIFGILDPDENLCGSETLDPSSANDFQFFSKLKKCTGLYCTKTETLGKKLLKTLANFEKYTVFKL